MREEGGYMSYLLDMLVCTHQSLNHSNQVRKASILCDKLTSGNENPHRKRREKESTTGGAEEKALEGRK